MKHIFLSLLLVLTLKHTYAQTETKIISDGLRFCESTLPYDGGILVANFGTENLNPLNTEGKGYIKLLKNGNTEVFIPADGNLSAPKGMLENRGRLFICDVNKIVVYNLKNRNTSPINISFPEGNLFVNDLVVHGKYLYASVTNTDKIFRIDISENQSSYIAEEWVSVPGPNGLYVDKNCMYIASYPADGKSTEKNVVYKIKDIKNPKIEKFITVNGQYDGIALSTDKKSMYLTNWEPAELSKIDLKTKSIKKVNLNLDKALVGPADLSVYGGYVYIPDLPNSRIVVFKE